MSDKPFKQVQVAADDWQEYKDLAESMSKELGVKVYINGAIKRAVTFYKESKK